MTNESKCAGISKKEREIQNFFQRYSLPHFGILLQTLFTFTFVTYQNIVFKHDKIKMIIWNCGKFVAFALLFPVLYTKGPTWIQFYTKFVIYYASLTISATICLPFTLLRPKDPRNLLWTNILMRKTATLLGKHNRILSLF